MNSDKIEIFCIYPYDRTTIFLNRIVTHMKRTFGDRFHVFKVKLNEKSHSDCMRELDRLNNKLIIFLGHGRSDKLYGACGDNAEYEFASPEARDGNQDFFCKEEFITIQNCNVLSNNIVFSLSCNSNVIKKSIGPFAVEKGARAFVGFGDIPTDYIAEIDFSLREISIFNGILVRIVKKSLAFACMKHYSVEKLVDIIKVLTNQEILNLILKCKGVKSRHKIAGHLFKFKDEIQIFGDRYASLVSGQQEK